jgi:hypothetical protein
LEPGSGIDLESNPEISNMSREKSTCPENGSISKSEEMRQGGRKVLGITTRGCTWTRRVREAVGSKGKVVSVFKHHA